MRKDERLTATGVLTLLVSLIILVGVCLYALFSEIDTFGGFLAGALLVTPMLNNTAGLVTDARDIIRDFFSKHRDDLDLR